MLIKCGGKGTTSLSRNWIPMSSKSTWGDVTVRAVVFYGSSWMEILNYLNRYKNVELKSKEGDLCGLAGRFMKSRFDSKKDGVKQFSYHDYQGPLGAIGTVLVSGGWGTILSKILTIDACYLGVLTTNPDLDTKVIKHQKTATWVKNWGKKASFDTLGRDLKRCMGILSDGKSHLSTGLTLGNLKDDVVDIAMGVPSKFGLG